ncbi:MAG: helix-turn-helix domain-containing protein [Proteobacteria bacterium]|nr:helix-turn-helix domain-containing protein [Pseudomonadota bacterium]
MRELCLPVGLDPEALAALDQVVTSRLRLHKGDALYRDGDPFAALYAIRYGSAKTVVLMPDGREQVAGYHLLGDIVGLDGVAHERHGSTAVALEDTEVCVIPFAAVAGLAREHPLLQKNLFSFLSKEVGEGLHAMLLLGSLRAEERIAVFLLNLGERYRRHGYSATEFVLRMTREEIGSYLGLKLETVSRLLSRFQAEGLVKVAGRSIKLIDIPALRLLAGQRC